MQEKEHFEPAKHLIKVQGGAEYLEVKWRLVWFRHDHPSGRIITNVEEHDRDEGYARVKARVEFDHVVDGNTIIAAAESTGTETLEDFPDYLEKAETKAIGRALAALGYGTQFAEDFEMKGANGTVHVVDTPINRRREVGTHQHNGPERELVRASCEECGKRLKPSKSTGTRAGMTVSEKAELSRKRTGRVLCYTCYQDAISV